MTWRTGNAGGRVQLILGDCREVLVDAQGNRLVYQRSVLWMASYQFNHRAETTRKSNDENDGGRQIKARHSAICSGVGQHPVGAQSPSLCDMG